MPRADEVNLDGYATEAYVGSQVATRAPIEGGLKAWASITYTTGAPTLNDSYNVSGITDDGIGLLTLSWSTAFVSTNYAIVATRREASGGTYNTIVTSKVTGSTSIAFTNEGVGAADPVGVDILAIGD